MSLCHFVIDPYKILILHALDKNHMMFICLFSLCRQKLNPVTMNDSFSHAVDYISTNRADIKL